ncbi:MAG TPA: MmgE/PrpD family protein [Xanthobacteraceae bacterium]
MGVIHKVSESRPSIQALADWSLRDEQAYHSDLVVRQSRLLVLDTIGCAIAGTRSDAAAAVLDFVLDSGGAPQCTIIGSHLKTSLTSAVLVNGVKVRSLDLNDVIFIQKEGKLSVGGHPSDNITVALSTGEMIGSTLGQVLEAIVVGYQMFSRLRDVMRFSSLWDGTSSSGIVAAAMAGRLLGLDAKHQTQALALAAARCATPKVVRWGALSSVKNLANALVAQSGVQAALLAARGLTGPMEVLDHEGGLRQLFDPDLGFEQLWADPPATLQIMRSNIKTFPCIGTAQALVAAALALAPKLQGRRDQIRRVEATMAHLPMIVNQQAEITRRKPRTREDADHSFTFLTAVALVDGALTERQLAAKRWLQPEMRALTAKVELKTSTEIVGRAPDSMPARVEVDLDGGERLVSECLYPPGHSFPERGLDRDVTVRKFRDVTDGLVRPGAADEIISFVLDGAQTQSISTLFSRLRIANSQGM